MKHFMYAHSRNVSLIAALLGAMWRTAARVIVPRLTRAVAMLSHELVRTIVLRVLLLVAVLAQIALLLVFGYLIDLSLSLMELWAELARKHLELTM